MDTPESLLNQELRALARKCPPEALAGDESFWQRVRGEYKIPADFVHLEYGYYHPACRAVFAREIEAMKTAQRRGSHYKRNEMTADREAARADLARLAGASPEEVSITRNATEALNIVVQGIPLEQGDEVVHSNQDYPSVVETLEQRARRDGLRLRPAILPLHPESDDEIVDRFAAAITPRTRVMLITHVINITGQLLPLRQLCTLARERHLQIIVDAAHSFAQIDFSLNSIDCDYLGASLHKWLGAPLGTGLLYVRRERIESLEPLFGDSQTPRADIRKLEHFGNRPDSAHVGLREAIRWHNVFGTAVKQARLRYLQRRWSDAVRTLPNFKMLTPREPSRHSAIGAFAVAGMEAKEVVNTLMAKYGIFVNAFAHEAVEGVRVTPGLPTSLAEIDLLVEALRRISGA